MFRAQTRAEGSRPGEPRPGEPRRVLVIDRGDRAGDPAGHQVHGFDMYARDLERDLGLRFDRVTALTLAEVERAFAARGPDTRAVVLMVSWGEPAAELEAVVRRLAATPGRPRLVFLDYYAQTSSPHFGVLPDVDVYVKRQVLRRRDLYQSEFRGGYVVTDYLARELGYRLDGWQFGSKPDPSLVPKLVPGWNLGVTPKYRRLLRLTRPLAGGWGWRPFAVNRRFGLPQAGKGEWYHDYRRLALDRLAPLAGRVRMTGTGRLSPRRYLLELTLSRVVVSPFGWGELCFRDYEAVAAGALLVKPSMEHLETNPDIFRPHETYVPVRWDLADLADTCADHLARPKRAVEIVMAAQRALRDYYERGGFVRDIGRVFGPAGGAG